MASKFRIAPDDQSYWGKLYHVARQIAHEINTRRKFKPHCRHCLNTRRGCDGCAEVEDFFPIIEKIVLDEKARRETAGEGK